MQESIAKALVSGALKTKDRITGEYQDPSDEDRETGDVDLQDFCDWARQAGITGAPERARDLAAAFGLQLEVLEASAPLGAKGFEPAQEACASQTETQEQRQARRYQACIDADLKLPRDDYAQLPRGIGRVADAEGISRQAFSQDVKAHITRLFGR